MRKRKIEDFFFHSAAKISKSALIEQSNEVPTTFTTETEIQMVSENENSSSSSTLCLASTSDNINLSEFEEAGNKTDDSDPLTAENLPICWTKEQALELKKNYPWLLIKKQKLGCSICRSISSLGAFKTQGLTAPNDNSWSCINIAPNGEVKAAQQKSLRKKICNHKKSKTHIASENIEKNKSKDEIVTVIASQRQEEQLITERIFRTAYHIAKKNRAFFEFENEIDVQILNGLDMGKILHSNVSATNIVNHISTKMQESLAKKIVENKLKFALILDESTSLSNKSCLIIYMRTQFPEMENPVNVFLSLSELEETNANGILTSLLTELKRFKIDEDILRENLIAITCDGASVMLGKKDGLCKKLLDMFPNIVVWHCLNHRLELSVADAVKLVAGLNNFKIFMDKLRNIYHSSPKNQRQLNACAANTGQELLKIGRILDVRWAASSLRSVKAVWTDYECLYKHFILCSTDTKRDAKEKETFSRLANKLAAITFVLNLGIMYDALEELSELSLELQNRQTTLVDAHRLIRLLIQVFESRMTKPVKHASEALAGVKNFKFKNVNLNEGSKAMPKIEPGQFYRCLADSIISRLLSVRERNVGTDSEEFISEVKVLNPKFWPASESTDITYGESEVTKLGKRFNLHERTLLKDFRVFRATSGKEVQSELKRLISVINSIPISSAECERGFSAMNLICTPQRASLTISTLSNLMFIRLVGPSINKFKPELYVRSWLASGHRSAIDTQSKTRKIKDADPDMLVLWDIFN